MHAFGDGILIAAAFVADYSIETSGMEIETIDWVFPHEIAPNRIRVAFNLRVYRSPDNDPVVDGYAPGSSKIGLAEQFGFTESKYVTVEIKDNLDQTILYMPQCWITSRRGSMSAGDFIVENWSLISIGYMGPPQVEELI